jgi:hypothetical protein
VEDVFSSIAAEDPLSSAVVSQTPIAVVPTTSSAAAPSPIQPSSSSRAVIASPSVIQEIVVPSSSRASKSSSPTSEVAAPATKASTTTSKASVPASTSAFRSSYVRSYALPSSFDSALLLTLVDLLVDWAQEGRRVRPTSLSNLHSTWARRAKLIPDSFSAFPVLSTGLYNIRPWLSPLLVTANADLQSAPLYNPQRLIIWKCVPSTRAIRQRKPLLAPILLCFLFIS